MFAHFDRDNQYDRRVELWQYTPC